MFKRSLFAVIFVLVTQPGCGDSSSGPAPDIDPLIVGTWADETPATDSTGVLVCTFVGQRLHLHDTGRFDWDTFMPDLPLTSACETTMARRDSGVWRAEGGTIVFTPAPAGALGPDLELAYELDGDELTVGPIVFGRESSRMGRE